MVISSRFHSTADCPEPGEKAADMGGPATSRPVAAAAAVAGAAIPATIAAAARKTAPFLVLRMFQGLLSGLGSADGICQQALSRGGAGSPTNTRSSERMFNQAGEGSELTRDWPGHRVLSD